MLEKQEIIDQITVLEDGQIQVRQKTSVVEDGVELSFSYHRHVISPGQPLGTEDQRVQDIAVVVHTPEVIADFRAAELARQ